VVGDLAAPLRRAPFIGGSAAEALGKSILGWAWANKIVAVVLLATYEVGVQQRPGAQAGPARIVFEASTKPELLKRWWAPKSTGVTLLSCEADVRVGGTYRFVFGHGTSEPKAFYGRYLEVTPHSRLVWTNEEGGDGSAPFSPSSSSSTRAAA
jgi:Activator of Hsp90 ATPase homolog 1-like protein